jgi:hypothetical protein
MPAKKTTSKKMTASDTMALLYAMSMASILKKKKKASTKKATPVKKAPAKKKGTKAKKTPNTHKRLFFLS